MNFQRCFRKSPDLYYTKPSQKPSDIRNCPRGGSQNSRRTGPNTANTTKELLASFKWNVLNHPTHSPVLAPSDYYLFEAAHGFQPRRRYWRRWRSGRRVWGETTSRKASEILYPASPPALRGMATMSKNSLHMYYGNRVIFLFQ